MISALIPDRIVYEGSLGIVFAGPVGYEAIATERTFREVMAKMKLGILNFFIIRTIVKEDGITLYGFLELHERDLFDNLLSVQGCGPKTCLSLLTLGASEVAGAIGSEDARFLSQASGVGPKLGERIVLELRKKFKAAILGASSEAATLIEALMTLGFGRQEVLDAIQHVSITDDIQTQIKSALWRLTG